MTARTVSALLDREQLSPRWLTNFSKEQFQFILESSSICWASNRSIFKLLFGFLSLSVLLS